MSRRRERAAFNPAALALALLAVVAAWLSYDSVRHVAVGVFGPVGGSAFPLLLDLGVFVSSEYFLASVKANRPMQGFRTLSHVLIGATVALNVSAATDARSAMFHAVPPALFAALVELRARKALGDVRAVEGRPDRIPLRLWITSPVESFRLSLWAARGVSHSGLRAERERHLTAVRALRIAVPGRTGRTARNLVRRQLRAGTLDPAALVAACGLSGTVAGTGPRAVLQVALRAALGAPEFEVTQRTSTASGKRASSAPVKRASRASGRASSSASKPLDDAQLKTAAEQLNAASLAATGEPVSLRKLQGELRIGQVKATALRDALKGASESAPEAASEVRIPLVLGDPIRRSLAGVNGTTAQH